MSSDEGNNNLTDLAPILKNPLAMIDSISEKNYNSESLHNCARRYDQEGLKNILKIDSSGVNLQDENGRTPLHLVLADGFLGHLNEDHMVACINVLKYYGADVNIADAFGTTPLSLAVDNMFSLCTQILLENGANCSAAIALKMGHSMPQLLLDIFNDGVDLDTDDQGDVMVKLDWRPVLQFSDKETSGKGDKKKFKDVQKETEFLYNLLDVKNMDNRSKLLKHPLVAAFLYFKNERLTARYKWFYFLSVLYPILYMIFVYFLYFQRCKFEVMMEGDNPVTNGSTTISTTTTGSRKTPRSHCSISLPIAIASYVLMTIISVWGFAELYMQIRVDRKYLTSWRTWVLRVAIVVMGVTLWPGLQLDDVYDLTFQYPIASLGIFLGWVMFLIQIGLYQRFSIYLEMLVKILLSVCKITLMFLPLFIGFFMGFNLMFSDMEGIFSYIMMTVDVGAVAYDKLINDAKEDAMWFEILAYTFCVGFIIIITVVFMNFLLALSIKDVEALKGQARMASISRQLQNLFAIDLVDPFSIMISNEHRRTGQWFYKYYPTNKNEVLPKNIRMELTLLLKAKKLKRFMEEVKKSEAEMVLTGDENLRDMTTVLMRRIQELEMKLDAVSNKILD